MTAVVEAGAKRDLVAGFLLTRPNLRFLPPRQGGLEVREPHIVLPGVNQRFRQYSLVRFLDPQTGRVDAWTRCVTIEAETVELWLGQLLERMDDLGVAQSEQAELVRSLASDVRAAKAKQPRFMKRALEAAALAIIAKLAVLTVDPLLDAIAPEIQQVVIETARFVERFF